MDAGHVTAGDARTAAAGAALLRAGGNAVDAAVAGVLAACVAEPVLTAPFGGGFALVGGPRLAPVAYDFFADIPGRGLPPVAAGDGLDFVGLEVSFGPTTQVFHAGRGATATPLLLPGLLRLQRDHGRLPLRQVVQPAAQLAAAGAGMSAQVAPIAHILTPILTLTPATAALFAPRGHVLHPGEPFVSPDLARLLGRLGDGDGDRDGGVAAAQEALLTAFGPPHGRLTEADLAAATVRTHAPVTVQLGAHAVALNPPPSLGGLLVALGLRLLGAAPAAVWRDETTALLQLFGCMAASQAARAALLDPAARAGSDRLAAVGADFLTADHVAQRQAEMAAAVAGGAQPGPAPETDLGSTTHVSALDAEGMACAITSSNGEGCGHLVPGAGVMANNFLGEEDINPGGFHVRPAGERLTSMMCPTLVLRDGVPTLALGTGGSNRIRTALLQVLVHHLLRGLPLEAAVQMPRLHFEGGPLYVEREVFGRALGGATLTALAQRVAQTIYFDRPNMFFGGVHVAARGAPGVGDPRRGGSCAT